MSHQCLKCGRILEEGSRELLKGCPACDGNHFFYTKEPLNEEERKKLNERFSKKLNSIVADIISDKLTESITEQKKVIPDSKENIDIITDAGYREKIIGEIESESMKSDTPGTINIEEPGKYTIDVKGLLEEEPIIIQKDGSYTIHLASVFKMIDKGKKN